MGHEPFGVDGVAGEATAELVVRNMRALSTLARRVGEEAAVDGLLEERPLILQRQTGGWLEFLKSYGVKVRGRGVNTRSPAHSMFSRGLSSSGRRQTEPRGAPVAAPPNAGL